MDRAPWSCAPPSAALHHQGFCGHGYLRGPCTGQTLEHRKHAFPVRHEEHLAWPCPQWEKVVDAADLPMDITASIQGIRLVRVDGDRECIFIIPTTMKDASRQDHGPLLDVGKVEQVPECRPIRELDPVLAKQVPPHCF